MKRVVLATLAILAVSTTAWAQDIRYNFDKSANFAKYKTYKWVENKSGDKLDDSDEEGPRERHRGGVGQERPDQEPDG